MGRWRSPRRGHHHILGGGIAHISPLCYTESEIPAALRATRHTAAFRTQRRREREGKYIRAAKRHIELGTARHPTARISKPYPRKGTETTPWDDTDLCYAFQNHIPARGRKLSFFSSFINLHKISKPYPRKGTETKLTYSFSVRVEKVFQNHIPARGRKRVRQSSIQAPLPLFQNHIPARGRKQRDSWMLRRCPPYFKTISPQGDGAYLQPPLPERGRGTA